MSWQRNDNVKTVAMIQLAVPSVINDTHLANDFLDKKKYVCHGMNITWDIPRGIH